MKYVLMFCETEQWQKDWDAKDQTETQTAIAAVQAWLDRHADVIVHRAKLDAADTATTVRLTGHGDPVITDGPFVEGKEIVSGYALVDVPDLDAALHMASTWPACPTIEIRPVTW
jgi:hypothetical protein